MVDEKDKLIGELSQELKAKDDQYVKHLKKQAEDIDLILERMEEQSRTLFKAYSEELAEIEKSFENERRKLVETQKHEWDKATDERSEKEKFYLEDRERRIEANEEEIQHLRVRNAEEVNQVKIKLETKIQSLQQEIQQMKATFQLNAEKLEYNYQVLKKRDEENMVTISMQKRRLTRLQDTLNNLRTKLAKQEKACKAEMQLLMDEYRKNTEQYRELMKKVKHFQAVDTKRFHDVWVMNEERVRKLAREVEGVDELVHQQQLGLDWERPPPIETPMAKKATKKPDNRNFSKATIYASQIISEAGSESSLADREFPIPIGPKESISSVQTYYTPVLIKQVLEMLCSECEFLIENKLLRLLAPLDQDEQLMMKLDSIFKAIGIETEEDIHHLVKHFIVKSETKTSVDERSDTDETGPVLIHPNEVLSRLTIFVQEQERSSGTSTPFLTRPTVGNYEELLDGEFWRQMALTLPASQEKVWGALLEVREVGSLLIIILGATLTLQFPPPPNDTIQIIIARNFM
jgi:dynein regulatory complex protein 1